MKKGAFSVLAGYVHRQAKRRGYIARHGGPLFLLLKKPFTNFYAIGIEADGETEALFYGEDPYGVAHEALDFLEETAR